MEISRLKLGLIGSEEAEEIIMEDPGRMAVHLLSYGAAIWKIFLPDSRGCMENVVLGLAGWRDYIDNPLYAGAVLCPNAGRIRQARLPLDSYTAALSKNDGEHNLHGGSAGASHRIWTVAGAVCEREFCSVTLSVHLPDGTDGFPGNRDIQICYTLRNSMVLNLDFRGTTDEDTYFNLSNHAYFNMSGDFARSGLEQELEVRASSYIANDGEHLPVSMEQCAGTPFDFSHPVPILRNMEAYPGDRQLLNAKGYNNGFMIEANPQGNNGQEGAAVLKKAASLADTASGRKLTLFTDAPCLVVYSGGYIGNSWRLWEPAPPENPVRSTEASSYSSESCAIALEPQDVPDACHFRPDGLHITGADEVYERRIQMQFGIV